MVGFQAAAGLGVGGGDACQCFGVPRGLTRNRQRAGGQLEVEEASEIPRIVSLAVAWSPACCAFATRLAAIGSKIASEIRRTELSPFSWG